MSSLFKNIAHLSAYFVLLASTLAHAESELPLLDAKFETVQCAIPCKKSVKRDWWLMRSTEQVELRDMVRKTGQLAKRGDIWKHSPQGKMGYLFLMHEEKRIIEYLFDDLNVLNIKSDENQWQIVSQLVTNSELANLKENGNKLTKYHGYSVEYYTGKINGAKVKLAWIPQLLVPLTLEYVYPKSKVTIQLQQLNLAGANLSATQQAPKTTEAVLDSYQQVFYTDIGDMEQNDDAKEWLSKAQGAPGLHAHHH